MPKDDGLEELLDTANDFERLSFYGGEITLEYSNALHAYTRMHEGKRILVPGVTSILSAINKPALLPWASNTACAYVRDNAKYRYVDLDDLQGEFIERKELEALLDAAKGAYRAVSRDATDIGHEAHAWLEQAIKAQISGEYTWLDLPEDERTKNCVQAALNWMEQHKFRPIAAERKIYSREYEFAGTTDWIGYVTSCGNPTCCPFEGERLGLGDFKSSKAIYSEYRLQCAAYQIAVQEEDPTLHIDLRVVLRLGKDDGAFEAMVLTNDSLEADFDGFLGTLSMYNWLKQIDLNKRHEKELQKASKPKKPRKPTVKVVIREAVREAIPVEVG